MKILAISYMVLVAVMSLVAFVAYGFDKQLAKAGARRVPEKTLHTLALFGGWPGALAAQRLFRHKTQKRKFRMVFWFVVFVHLGIVSGVAYAISSGGITPNPPVLIQPEFRNTR